MKWLAVGLGNPGDEYLKTRHNVGWRVLDAFVKHIDFPDWEESNSADLLYSNEKLGKHWVELIKPTTFMNKSGKAVQHAAAKHKIPPERVILVHDDIDMALGKLKIVTGRGSGGHKGVESVARSLKTKDFIRVKVGVLPTTPTGKPKKPKGEKKVLDFIMKDFSKKELPIFKKQAKLAAMAMETIIGDDIMSAMNKYN